MEAKMSAKQTEVLVFEEEYPAAVNPEDAKRARMRRRILEEIQVTEETYQQQLSLVVKLFEEPLRENGLVPLHVVTTLFSNIGQLLRVNQELSEHLKTMGVGQAFLVMGPFLKLYSTYANNHERALAALMEWEQKSEEFAAWRRAQEEMPAMQGLKLNALLITPVQRIPRYKLLLEELLQNTFEDTEEYSDIKECVCQVSEVASHINEHIKQQDNFMKMAAIQRSLVGPTAPRIIIPSRIFIKEGNLRKVHKKGGWSRERKFYLFSDMLMYAKPRLLENSQQAAYSCCCIMPLHHCKVQRLFGNRHGEGSLFTIQCKEESLLLYSDQETVDIWIKVLTKAINDVQTSRKSLRKPSSAKTPLRKPALIRMKKQQQNSDPLENWGKPSPQNTKSPRTLKRTLMDSKINCLSPKSSSVKEAREQCTIQERCDGNPSSPDSPRKKSRRIDQDLSPEEKTCKGFSGIKTMCSRLDERMSSLSPKVRSPGKYIVKRIRNISGKKPKTKVVEKPSKEKPVEWAKQFEQWDDQSKDLDSLPSSTHTSPGGSKKDSSETADLWISPPHNQGDHVRYTAIQDYEEATVENSTQQPSGQDKSGGQPSCPQDVMSPQVTSFVAMTSTPVEMPFQASCKYHFEDELSPEVQQDMVTAETSSNKSSASQPVAASSPNPTVEPTTLKFIAEEEDSDSENMFEDEDGQNLYELEDCDLSDEDQDYGEDTGSDHMEDSVETVEYPGVVASSPSAESVESFDDEMRDVSVPVSREDQQNLRGRKSSSRPLSVIEEMQESPSFVFIRPTPRPPIRSPSTPKKFMTNTLEVTKEVLLSPTTAEISQRACVVQ